MLERRRRITFTFLVALFICGSALLQNWQQKSAEPTLVQTPTTLHSSEKSASEALGKLMVKGRAPKTGYARSQFGDGWQELGACNVRNHILKRDMSDVKVLSDTDCTVVSGMLQDPYTGKRILFVRGALTSDDIQIDHIVALSDAWQKGAQQLSSERREVFANDPLNLLAVDGAANQQKGDGDAATWLPPNKAYRCAYVARQIAVKTKYELWITQAEHDAMQRVLSSCLSQKLPEVTA